MDTNKEEIKDFILKLLEEKNAENIITLPINSEVSIADYMIFASGRSVKNISAIAEHIALELKHTLKWNASVEGLKGSDWILLDAGDVIVHLFHPEAREKFKIEELWKAK
ncbi:MAG: ribosome silencing factor [Rickettsiales bacterium]|nr:MAG: ribosome silencing factor [Rickettsiales bacterium]